MSDETCVPLNTPHPDEQNPLSRNLAHGNNMFLCVDTNVCTKLTVITYEGLAGSQDERAFIAKL